MSVNPQELVTIADDVARVTLPESVSRLEITLGDCRVLMHSDGRIELDGRVFASKGFNSVLQSA